MRRRFFLFIISSIFLVPTCALSEETQLEQFLRNEYLFAEFSEHAEENGQSILSPLIREEETLAKLFVKEHLDPHLSWQLACAFYEAPYSSCGQLVHHFIKFKQMQSLGVSEGTSEDASEGIYEEKDLLKGLSKCG